MKAKKFDGGKPDYSLLPLDLLETTVRALEFGAKTYGRDNYRLGFDNPYRPLAAALRHIAAIEKSIQTGDSAYLVDTESGTLHTGHAIASLLMLENELRHHYEFNRHT